MQTYLFIGMGKYDDLICDSNLGNQIERKVH